MSDPRIKRFGIAGLKKPKRTEEGFTLVELIAVIIIMGIIKGVG